MIASMIDGVFAATLNPNIERKQDRHKPRPLDDFLPGAAYRQPVAKKVNQKQLISKLDQLAGIKR